MRSILKPNRATARTLTLFAVALATMIGLSTTTAQALPIFPGYQVEVYADVPDPVRITFAPNRTMFVGRDSTGANGQDVLKIRRDLKKTRQTKPAHRLPAPLAQNYLASHKRGWYFPTPSLAA